MTCPYCGGPDVECIGDDWYVCHDCGEEFGRDY